MHLMRGDSECLQNHDQPWDFEVTKETIKNYKNCDDPYTHFVDRRWVSSHNIPMYPSDRYLYPHKNPCITIIEPRHSFHQTLTHSYNQRNWSNYNVRRLALGCIISNNPNKKNIQDIVGCTSQCKYWTRTKTQILWMEEILHQLIVNHPRWYRISSIHRIFYDRKYHVVLKPGHGESQI